MCQRIIVLLIACFAVNAAAALPGCGTEQDPWRIESLADFNKFAADANYWAGFTRLETDVNLAGLTYTTAVIAPDTNSSQNYFQGTAFSGVFDGNDRKFINLTIDDGGAGSDCLGLFGCIHHGEVSNLGLEGGSVSGDREVGGLVGWNEHGSVSNCYCTGDVTGYLDVGGLVGENEGRASNCYSTGDVSSGGYLGCVGGLVGDNDDSVSNCYSTGNVSGTCDYVGGLVGYNDEGISVSHCYSTGSVSGRWYVGGLVGKNNLVSVSNCYSTGYVSGYHNIGGLVGSSSGPVSNCYSTGDVSGNDEVGGLVGYNFGSVSNCYSTGSVSGDDFFGGLVGWNRGSVSNCFWDIETQKCGVTDSIGYDSGTATNVAGLPTAQMQTENTFTSAGWDFVEIWNIGERQTYPYLRQYPAGDLNHDGSVDLWDFAILAGHWLEGTGG